MIDSTTASKQIQRLCGLDFFPKNEPAALKELRLAAESAATPAILVSVVDSWLREQTQCPKPAELRRIIWGRQELPKPDEKCECSGTGMLIRWVLSWNGEENGEMARKRRYVSDDVAGRLEAARLPPAAMASVCSTAVPCRCQKKTGTAA